MFGETAQQEADRLLKDHQDRRGIIGLYTDADPGPLPCRKDEACRCRRHDPIGMRIERFADRHIGSLMIAASVAISVLVCVGIGGCGL